MENKYLNLIVGFFIIINTLLLIPSALVFAFSWYISIVAYIYFQNTLDSFIVILYALLSIISFPFVVYSLVMFLKFLSGKIAEKNLRTVLLLTTIFHFLIGLFITLLVIVEFLKNNSNQPSFDQLYLLIPIITIYLSIMGYFLTEPDTNSVNQ